ncbi:MAG: hypothetical protein FJZ00_05650 [Candidatus Sericytochromatia bacterium]|uniref:Uncharacterized protein n=1 Tax=Candidatus Tanganyikabacteria bacterium TaxID=2961651 RepID=A0A937X2C5_9BACT|nr:hypothetical protein [Candidatus Tanganyikabacteria bacterium]
MSVEIGSCVIERHDGPMFCGILFYSADEGSRYVPWSVDLQNPRQVVLKLFPPDAKQNYELVRDHYERMADVIVDKVMTLSDPDGRKTDP